MELGVTLLPAQEEDAQLAVTSDLIALVIRVKLHPMLVLEFFSVLELEADDRPFFFFVCPVPERDGLRLVVPQGH